MKKESEGKEIEGGLKRTSCKGRESKGKVKGRRECKKTCEGTEVEQID